MFSEWSEIEDQLKTNGFDVGSVREELISGFESNRNMAELRQRQVAGQINCHDHYNIDGLGACVARIDLDAYFYWAMRESPECWNDKQFIHEYLRDNPDVRVNSRSASTTIIRP